MYYIEYYGDKSRKLRDVAQTLRGAKCLATQRLDYGMNACIYDQHNNAICFKGFYSDHSGFGWCAWQNV